MDGEQMRELRQELRLSQGDLKDELNRRLNRSYDKPKISRWENGREAIPDDVSAELEAMVSGRPRSARTLTLSNHKGGVAKTTSALNLACALAQMSRRVLLIDMDPQATATVALLAADHVTAYKREKTMAHVILRDRPLSEIIITKGSPDFPSYSAPFDLAASHIELSETDARREPGSDVALREAVEGVLTSYDFIVVDSPPNLGALTTMALTCAQDVIIPVRSEPYDTMGVGLIISTINKVQRRLNAGLRLAGILPTQYNHRKSVDREVLAHLARALGDKAPVLEPIAYAAAFGHAARDGRIAIEVSPSSPGVVVYRRLAEAIVAGAPLPRADIDAVMAAEG
ncbi:AAA family ATPase [Roseomonas genomospecies 6]|uniref:Chromosome partitioning protein ParA n=1 Tax=Roseomonas genomospecies 6 TaxID=214106 RepID=A0A9W7KQM3_9PROT|nr:AAA family ATPase [Roseomonas genomospecies 6]KAA0677606.1 XRE family transcriptional regulator [Roseomonas genomospecies 6]